MLEQIGGIARQPEVVRCWGCEGQLCLGAWSVVVKQPLTFGHRKTCLPSSDTTYLSGLCMSDRPMQLPINKRAQRRFRAARETPTSIRILPYRDLHAHAPWKGFFWLFLALLGCRIADEVPITCSSSPPHLQLHTQLTIRA